MLGDHVTVYLLLCLESVAIGLTAQGWKHRTVWRHKMLAQPWRAPLRDRWLSESSFTGSHSLHTCLRIVCFSSPLPPGIVGDTWGRRMSTGWSQSRHSFKDIAVKYLNTNKKDACPSWCDGRQSGVTPALMLMALGLCSVVWTGAFLLWPPRCLEVPSPHL